MVEIVDGSGAARIRVTAPAAYGRGGRNVGVRLAVRASHIELIADVDAGGEPLLVDPVWSATTGSMSSGRKNHTATLLGNRKVLVTGGMAGKLFLSSAELYEPSTDNFSSAGTMPLGDRAFHEATLLLDGKVLLIGGRNGGGILSSTELYDPGSNTWITSPATASMSTARSLHAAARPQNGKVLVTGGRDNSGFLHTSEVYDPATNTWSSPVSMTERAGHTATLMRDGRVLAAGGADSSGTILNSSETYDPATDSWTATANNLKAGHVFHRAVLLPSGQVMVASGVTAGSTTTTTRAELFDPVTSSWVVNTFLNTGRFDFTLSVMDSGHVVAAGGLDSTPLDLSSVERFDPVAGTWSTSALPSLGSARQKHAAARLTTNKLLVPGGQSGSFTLSSAEILAPTSTEGFDKWSLTATGNMAHVREFHSATTLDNGKVLVVGGTDGSVTHRDADLFDPSTNSFSAVSGLMSNRRMHHTATVITGGLVLVVGGYDGAGGGTTHATADLFDPSTGSWSATTSMTNPRKHHTATRLQDGRVLVVGGDNGSTFEIFNPSTTNWSSPAALPAGRSRARHTATLLPDGKVLVVGGEASLGTADLFDPNTNTFSATGSLNTGRSTHTAALLDDGRVLVAAGDDGTGGSVRSSAELYLPSSGTWTTTGSLATGRTTHVMTRLASGRVLVAAGAAAGSEFSSVEIFDPVGVWTTTNSLIPTTTMNPPYAVKSAAAALLQDGRVVVMGGYQSAIFGRYDVGEIFSPL